MTQYSQLSRDELDKTMTADQFTQVVAAIASGKYSWACVLILRFAGYNPLHYIPYRTYNRLVKENARPRERNACPADSARSESRYSVEMSDLAYLQTAEPSQRRGGSFSQWIADRIQQRVSDAVRFMR